MMEKESYRLRKTVLTLLVLVIAVCVAGALLRDQLGIARHGGTLLMTASTLFVLIAVAGFTRNRSPFSAAISVGLAFCWLGDYFGSRHFVLSVVSFLMGHIAFISAFLLVGIKWQRVLYSAASTTVFSTLLFYWLVGHLPQNIIPLVLGYVLVISTMVTFSAGVPAEKGGRFLLPAAVIFYVSDIFVARWKFVDASSINAFFCYPLYYLACVLFGLSAWRRKK